MMARSYKDEEGNGFFEHNLMRKKKHLEMKDIHSVFLTSLNI